MTVARSLANVRFRGYFDVLTTPGLYELYTAAHRGLRQNRVRDDTQLVLDGFPRSANTYSRVAFDMANHGCVSVSSHTHSPRTVQLARRRDIPCIVLIRHPVDSVISLMQWMPGLSAQVALRYYVKYYESLLPYRREVVIARFDTVVESFGEVIAECNARFGTAFKWHESTVESEAAIRARIEELSRQRLGDEARESAVARPSAVRRRVARELRASLPADEPLVHRAGHVWEQFAFGGRTHT